MVKRILVGAGVVLLIALIASGWGYSLYKDRQNTKALELVQLNTSFAQQYGTDGITIKQFAQPDKVYTAVWTSKDGAAHISWNIGGYWVTIYNGTAPTAATPATTQTPDTTP